jgi:hypothetical protein
LEAFYYINLVIVFWKLYRDSVQSLDDQSWG